MDSQTEIKEKYLKLREVYYTLVGHLYPEVVYKQLMELAEAYQGNDLPTVRPPNERGYVV